MGLIYNQLALWSFYEGEYQEAVDNAAAAHKVWVRPLAVLLALACCAPNAAGGTVKV